MQLHRGCNARSLRRSAAADRRAGHNDAKPQGVVAVKMLAVMLAILGNVSAPPSFGIGSAFVDYLRPTLKDVGGAARVYYAATCAAEKDTLLFPTLTLKAPREGATGIAAVQQIFRDDPHVTVAQDRSGMLRITIGSVSTAILQTRIRALTLDPTDQYNPIPAVRAVANTPEVNAAERSLDLARPLMLVDYIIGAPIEGQPHLPKLTRNVTVDEALDSIARTFKGIIMYGICHQPNGKSLYQLTFVEGS
jgi:hypothetical protein